MTTHAVSARRRWWSRGLLLAGALAVVGSGYVCWRAATPVDEPPAYPVPPVSASPFRNTRPDVAYVGSARCRACHADEHASFGHTGMGRSMAPVDLAREPPDAAFDHPKSK